MAGVLAAPCAISTMLGLCKRPLTSGHGARIQSRPQLKRGTVIPVRRLHVAVSPTSLPIRVSCPDVYVLRYAFVLHGD